MPSTAAKWNNSRSMHKYKLAWQWILRHRPDVAAAIMREIDKRYPRRMQRIPLPVELEKLK